MHDIREKIQAKKKQSQRKSSVWCCIGIDVTCYVEQQSDIALGFVPIMLA